MTGTQYSEILNYCMNNCPDKELDNLSVIECAISHCDCPLRYLKVYQFMGIQRILDKMRKTT